MSGMNFSDWIDYNGLKMYLFDDNFPMPYREPEVDCEECSAPCCVQFTIPLTPRETRVFPLDPVAEKQHAFYLDKSPGCACQYLKNGKCSIWDIRPITCREYTCVGDSRITRS